MIAHRRLRDRDVGEFRQDAAIQTSCRVPLFARCLTIRRQNLIDERHNPAQLRFAAFWIVVLPGAALLTAPAAPNAGERRTSRQLPLSSQYRTHAPDGAARTNPLW